MSEQTVGNARPYHEMTLREYAATGHSQTVPRWSILAIAPETYTVHDLCQFGTRGLRALAFLWRVTNDGAKKDVAERIMRRSQFRAMLAKESESSLAGRGRKELLELAKEAGVYHPWLNRKLLAATLIQWREDARRHARLEIARANHERLVRTAARRGLFVPVTNLSHYGLDANGDFEPTILGNPLSRALEFAPEAIAEAKRLSSAGFLDWVKANPISACKVALLEAGALGDGGKLFWRHVQKAFAPPKLLPLFASLGANEQEFVPEIAGNQGTRK